MKEMAFGLWLNQRPGYTGGKMRDKRSIHQEEKSGPKLVRSKTEEGCQLLIVPLWAKAC